MNKTKAAAKPRPAPSRVMKKNLWRSTLYVVIAEIWGTTELNNTAPSNLEAS